jgi:hypothetical protein
LILGISAADFGGPVERTLEIEPLRDDSARQSTIDGLYTDPDPDNRFNGSPSEMPPRRFDFLRRIADLNPNKKTRHHGGLFFNGDQGKATASL